MPTSSSQQLARHFRIYQSLLGLTTTKYLQLYQHSCSPCYPYHQCHSRASNYRLRRQYKRRYSTSSCINNHTNNKCISRSTIAVHRLTMESAAVHHSPRNQDPPLHLDTMYHPIHNIHLSTPTLPVNRAGTRIAHTQADQHIDESHDHSQSDSKAEIISRPSKPMLEFWVVISNTFRYPNHVNFTLSSVCYYTSSSCL
jgi:hypothetical protein